MAVRSFTVVQIVQIVAMTGHAMTYDRYYFLGVMKWHVMMGCITSYRLLVISLLSIGTGRQCL